MVAGFFRITGYIAVFIGIGGDGTAIFRPADQPPVKIGIDHCISNLFWTSGDLSCIVGIYNGISAMFFFADQIAFFISVNYCIAYFLRPRNRSVRIVR